MKTTQTATNKGVECWIGRSHRNQRNDKRHTGFRVQSTSFPKYLTLKRTDYWQILAPSLHPVGFVFQLLSSSSLFFFLALNYYSLALLLGNSRLKVAHPMRHLSDHSSPNSSPDGNRNLGQLIKILGANMICNLCQTSLLETKISTCQARASHNQISITIFGVVWDQGVLMSPDK